MDELRKAIEIADRILDRPNGDPDDDLAVMARQLTRLVENAARLLRNPDAPDFAAYRRRLCAAIDPDGAAQGLYG